MTQSQPFIWSSLQIFIKVVRSVPHEKAVALGGALGSAAAFFSNKKVKEATARCAKILGVRYEEARKIVFASYSHFGRAAAEFARLPLMADKIDEFVKSEGHEHLFRAVKSGRGAILATAHVGNWEYAASWLARRGLPVNTLGADQRDPRITELVRELREAGGCRALGKANDLKAMMRALQNGEIIAVPVDQDAKKSGVVSPFLGSPASSPTGPARLAARLGCDVIPGVCVRSADGVTFEMTIHPPLKGRNGEPFGKNIQTSVDDLNEIISNDIRKYPSQWLWAYPRWESVERGMFDETPDLPPKKNKNSTCV